MPRRSSPSPKPPPKRAPTRGRDGVTSDEREQPLTSFPPLLEMEHTAAEGKPDQLPLFSPTPTGGFEPTLAGLTPLAANSSLDLARSWYRRELEQAKRPKNTIESYCYDLTVLEHLIGPKRIDRIDRRDIARYLGESSSRTTRKRRLTSARRFFRFLIDDARVLERDPTDGFYPHAIQLQTPVPLFPAEQAALMTAAEADEPWSAPAIWLMMRLGLSRAELLALRRDHIDRTDPERPVVFIFYADRTKHGKERKLAGDEAFATLYEGYLAARDPEDLLFPVGPQAVNGMVDRVRKEAGISKEVTPQTLRHTFAVDQARDGADEERLLKLLGLADDPRNRASVQRYIKLAEPPANASAQPKDADPKH